MASLNYEEIIAYIVPHARISDSKGNATQGNAGNVPSWPGAPARGDVTAYVPRRRAVYYTALNELFSNANVSEIFKYIFMYIFYVFSIILIIPTFNYNV